MNRIKIIKRANLPLSIEERETEMKTVGSVNTKRHAVKVIGSWIDEWRAAKPKDVRRAFADLFGASPPATG